MKGVVAEPPVKGELKTLPVDRLFASPANPRVIVDDQAQAELNADVLKRGVLTPLIVRKVKGRYEVLAGARRLKAAKAARQKQVPARVVEVDDAAAHEIMVVENLQRKDIHPLDEAVNFQIILDRNNGDVLALAERVHKKPAYIQKVLVLNRLTARFKDWFRKGTLERDAAFAIARLQEPDQDRYYKDLEDGDKQRRAVSYSDVADWTMRHVLRDLARVPWDVKDAALDPQAGPCTTCPKRTGISKDMFVDVAEGDSCTDGACFSRKLDLSIAALEKKLGSVGVHYWYISKQQYETVGEGPARVLGTKDYYETTADKKCETLTKGLVKTGPGAGTAVWICTTKKCRVHRLSLGNHGERVSAKEAEEIKEQKQDRVRETKIRDQVLTAIVNKTTAGFGKEDMALIANAMFGRLWHEYKKRFLKRHGVLKPPSKVTKEAPPDYDALFRKAAADLSAPEFAQHLIEMSLIQDVDAVPMDDQGADLYEAAKRFKIDVPQIRKLVDEEIRQARLPKKAKARK